jgi:ribulose 1,5-bisphosphate carboxylase large subunit-like protein
MKPLSPKTLEALAHDEDAREVLLRRVVAERLAEMPAPLLEDQIVATYFFALRSLKLSRLVEEISYHATSGIRNPPPGTLLADCTGKGVGINAFDQSERVGLLHMAYPLKMMLQPDGHVTSCDILHTAAGAIIFDVYEILDARLLGLQIPPAVIQSFPGPAWGPLGIRARTNFKPDQPAFGTILKPTAGLVPSEVGTLVEEAARCQLFLFVKEDENLYPNLDYSPVRARTRQAVEAIDRARDQRGGLGLIFAPHITGSPHEILDTVHAVMEAGATAVMFSETHAGGTVRMVRESTRTMSEPPAIYGHNAGIGVKTRAIWREVIDLLARLDGIDFRQTAPVRHGRPFIRPHGMEWEASEDVLTRPLPGIKPTMIARAGGLDQGNIGLNLAEVEKRGLSENILFLAGSAINSIKNDQGRADPQLGALAMQQALEVHHSGVLRKTAPDEYLPELAAVAERCRLTALREAIKQRYPGVVERTSLLP